MAEAAMLGVAKSVLGQLSSPALKEFLLVWNFKGDLDRLGKTIETITCFIHDAEKRQSKEQLVKLWLSRLKVVLYEADDLVDTIAARALRKKSVDGGTFKKEESLWLHDIPWKLLPSLRELRIDSGLSSIPDGIQLLNSLQRLTYYGLELEEIPKWMINLTSLQRLILGNCSQELVIRCEPKTGADWHLISHIPRIDFVDYGTNTDMESEDEE